MALSNKRKAAINQFGKLIESAAPNLKAQSQSRYEWLCEYCEFVRVIIHVQELFD